MSILDSSLTSRVDFTAALSRYALESAQSAGLAGPPVTSSRGRRAAHHSMRARSADRCSDADNARGVAADWQLRGRCTLTNV
eukprot:6207010-Pleurochrysis_carterae.AAC.2